MLRPDRIVASVETITDAVSQELDRLRRENAMLRQAESDSEAGVLRDEVHYLLGENDRLRRELESRPLPPESLFSPAPWRYFPEDALITDSGDATVCKVYGFHHAPANGRLLAAAPRLLEELETVADLLERVENTLGTSAEVQDARALIKTIREGK